MSVYQFDGHFIAKLTVGGFDLTTRAIGMDRFDRVWQGTWPDVSDNNSFRCIDQTGTIVASYTNFDITSQVSAYALANQSGASWLASGADHLDAAHGIAVFNLNGQSYLVYTLQKLNSSSGSSATWFSATAIFQINADASLTIKGLVWALGITAGSLQTGRTFRIDLAGGKGFTDPILVVQSFNTTAVNSPYVIQFPSVSDIIGKCSPLTGVRHVWPGPFTSPGDEFNPLACGFPDVVGTNAGLDQESFFLPNALGGTDIFVYIGAGAMAAASMPFVTALRSGGFPNGCLVKATLSLQTVAFSTTPTISDFNIGSAAGVSGVFIDGGGTPYDYFSDVGTNFDGTGSHGSNQYFPAPRVIANGGLSGGWTVAWYAPYFINDTYVGANWSFYEKLRIQTYAPSTGQFTDVQLLKGPTVTIEQLGGSAGLPTDFMDVSGWDLFQLSGGNLRLWHYNGPSATSSAANVTWLAELAAFQRRSMVWSNIGHPQL